MPLPTHTTKYCAQGKLLSSVPTDTRATVPSSAVCSSYQTLQRISPPCSLHVETSPAQTHPCPPNNAQPFSASVVTIPSLTSDNSPILGELAQVDTWPSPLVPLLLSPQHLPDQCPHTGQLLAQCRTHSPHNSSIWISQAIFVLKSEKHRLWYFLTINEWCSSWVVWRFLSPSSFHRKYLISKARLPSNTKPEFFAIS